MGKLKILGLLAIYIAAANAGAAYAYAAETATEVESTVQPVSSAQVVSEKGPEKGPEKIETKTKTKTKTKGRREREKDTDGTEAPDRFEADTVIKSGYKRDGQPLEVDPD